MPPYTSPNPIRYQFGGGVNEGLPATEIEPNQNTSILNFYPFGKKLIRRGGIRRVTSSAYTEELVSFFPFKRSTGDWTLIVGSLSGFGKLSGTGILVIPTETGLTLVPVAIPWVMVQYNDVAYAVRQGDGRLLRITPDLVSLGGIVEASTAPVIAQGAAGALAAGAYAAVVTGYNTLTGVESNPSPKSNVLSLASLKKIDYSSIPVFANPQVNARRIYRTLLDQVNEYFFAAQINDNTTTTYTGEEVLPEDMGDPVLFDNFTPPNLLRWIAVWNERMFGTDGTDVLYSNAYNMEGWPSQRIPVYRDDGHEIRVLHPFGDRLVIGKTNKVHFLIGADRSTFKVLTLSDKHGCMAGHSMKSAEGLLFWYGSGHNVYRSDGNNTVGIGDIKVKRLLESIPDDLQEQVCAETFPTLSQYVLTVPQTGYSQNRKVAVYNYRTDAWSFYTHPGAAPSYLAEFFDASYGRALYGCQYDGYLYHLYQKGQGTDYGTPVAASLLTRREDGGTIFAKSVRRVNLLCSSAAEEITLSLYRDGRSVPSASRSVSLNVDSEWKPINLSTLRDPGSTVQLGIEYNGTTEIELEAVELEVDLVERTTAQPQ